jgi:transglutaminase-like putative cysteine protease
VTPRRLKIDHTSRYSYSGVVQSSYNEVRLTPLSTPCQQLLDLRVRVTPQVPLYTYIDYWGTQVHAFDIHSPHDTLTVASSSVVEMSTVDASEPDVTWASLETDAVSDDFGEFLDYTSYVPSDGRIAGVAGSLSHTGSPGEAAIAALSWVGAELTYKTGATGVHTSGIQAWEGGEGVCQDFAHLSLCLLRAMKIPARYCSGYVYPSEDVTVGAAIPAESHAWVEYWVGDWVAVDPTAGAPVSDRHVLVARGRDYSDVAPVKGIFNGGPTSGMQVDVRLTPLA